MGGESGGLAFSELLSLLKTTVQTFPDKRQGKNCHYSIEDICLSGFSVFFTQSPSFLAYQKAMKHAKGISNATTVFDLSEIPTDNHVQSILDEVSPEHLNGVFDEVLNRLEKKKILPTFRSFGNDVLVAIDGTQ